MEKKTLGSFLSALRKASGLTQKQLAEKLNVSDKAISRWERDEAMPDLTLIPVLAEIFGVTSDEILRGERCTLQSVSTAQEEKTEKQKKRILTDKRTKLRVRSIITIGIGLLGLIAAMICNFGFLRAHIGFMVGCVFFLGAVICQVIFTLLHLSGMDEEILTPQELGTYRMDTIQQTFVSVGTILVLVAMTLPLALYPWDTYQGLDIVSWASYGLIFAVVTCIVCVIAYAVTIILLARKQLVELDPRKKGLYKLRLIFTGVAILTLGLILITQSILNSVLPRAIMTGREFNNWDSFVEYMEMPVKSNGSIASNIPQGLYSFVQTEPVGIPDESTSSSSDYVIMDDDGSVSVFPETPKEQVFDKDGNVICEFTIQNEDVYSWNIKTNSGKPTITVYTWQDKMKAMEIMDGFINPTFMLLYPLSLLIIFLIYRKKAHLLQ